jgi:hypothetical protein
MVGSHWLVLKHKSLNPSFFLGLQTKIKKGKKKKKKKKKPFLSFSST